ncbi:biotin--[acetyl-CoA-carboxylase] ligase [Lactiplantibacillus garii]|uniref:Bifunctional ligase/repressor BirA n=1 Tax=Lactiplantibacillus garii TaxID=2306423 RepID=A0A426D9Z2_9LACO|nr:biotin--[acetyl-CoA-carboxylase] ligase [Lactiplantibacillus garii]RRK11397.1 biotin--[acetyl-CoA-carboxylase] ligase [Lactiplantibacillus garii]
MANQTEVLRLLMANAPEYCSGDRLADELNISRTAIWKMVQGLQTAGYSIESRHGRGYRYVENNQLSVAGIQNGLDITPAVQLIVLPSVDSTNAYLKRMATRTPLTEPVVVVADSQTAGYGRSGRTFYSPGETGIYLSIGLPVTTDQPLDAGLLTTSTAVVVAQTLRQLFDVPVELKWVNDVLVNHHKVVGIMSEGITNLETGQISTVVVGIGINLTTAAFPSPLQSKAGAVLAHPTKVTRNQVIRQLLRTFFERYPSYRSGDFMPLYRQLSMVINQRVSLKSGARTYDGVVLDIAQTGALVVQLTDGRVQEFSSGEITKVNLLTGQYHG